MQKCMNDYTHQDYCHAIIECFFNVSLQNGLDEIKKLAKFLGVPKNDELCEAINEKCHFSKMVKDKAFSDEISKKIFKGNFGMYRKGNARTF